LSLKACQVAVKKRLLQAKSFSKKTCGKHLRLAFSYVSLRAVSDNKKACKLLKTIDLKFYFNF
jgi:hypothetical protein